MENSSISMLPQKGVVFLGGHQNLTNKLHQRYPRWQFVSDEQLKRTKQIKSSIVFYWSKHGSHKLMQYAFSKLPLNAEIYYVTATNLARLEREMLTRLCQEA